MKQSGRLLNARQTGYLLTASVVAYKLVNLPALLCAGSGRNMWLGALLLMLWELVLTVAFVVVNRLARGRTLGELLQCAFGRTVKRVVLGVFALYFLLKIYLSVLTAEQFLTTNLYDNIGWVAFGLPLILVAAYGSVKGLRATGRAAELIGVPIVIGMAIALGVELINTDWGMLLPFAHNAGNALGAAERCLMGTGDAVVTFVLIGRVESKGLARRAIGATALSTVFIVLFCACFYGFYGQAGMYMRHGLAISDMLQYVGGSDTLLRLDIFASSATVLLSLFKITFFTCAANACIREAVGLGDTERNRAKIALGTTLLLVVSEYALQRFLVDVYTALEGWWKYIAIVPFQVLIPLLTVIALIVVRGEPRLQPYRRLTEREKESL